MANVSGGVILELDIFGGIPGGISGGSWDIIGMGGIQESFKMRGKDVDMLPSIVYRVWVVVGSPDFAAAQYTGPKGGPTPFSDVTATIIS